MIVDGWFDWAERLPGPAEKVYSGANSHTGIVVHSMAGTYDNALSRMMGADRASWKGSILLDGRLIQHYPMDASCWTSGSAYANTMFDAFETEGAQPQMFTGAQLATWQRIISELSAAYHWTPRRPADGADTTATCWEHNEMTRFNAAPTACPDGRADWARMIRGRMYTDAEIDAKVGEALALGVRNQQNISDLANGQDALPPIKGMLRYLWALAGKPWPF